MTSDKAQSHRPCPTRFSKRNGWKDDLRESTPKAIKYRRGEGEIIIVVHQGRGWFDPDLGSQGRRVFLPSVSARRTSRFRCKAVAELVGFEPSAPAWRRSRNKMPEAITSRWSDRAVPRPGSPAWSYLTSLEPSPKRLCQQQSLPADSVKALWDPFGQGISTPPALLGWEERGPIGVGSHAVARKRFSQLEVTRRFAFASPEAAIDAMSLAALEEHRADSTYASTGAAGRHRRKARSSIRLPTGAQIVAASGWQRPGILMRSASGTYTGRKRGRNILRLGRRPNWNEYHSAIARWADVERLRSSSRDDESSVPTRSS